MNAKIHLLQVTVTESYNMNMPVSFLPFHSRELGKLMSDSVKLHSCFGLRFPLSDCSSWLKLFFLFLEVILTAHYKI